MGLSQNALARAVHVAPRRINEIVLGQAGHHRRHRSAARPLFRPVRRVLPGLQMDHDLMQRRREIDRDLKTIRRARRDQGPPHSGDIATHGQARPRSAAKPLSVLLSDVFSDAYAKQGSAARELVTRWAEIAGARQSPPIPSP